MGYRDYNNTLKTLNHYQSKTSEPSFIIDSVSSFSRIVSNHKSYCLHPYQEIEDPNKDYKRDFSAWFINKNDSKGAAFYILDKQENLNCITKPYPSKSDYLKEKCLVCSNLTRYKIKAGWISYGYEHLLNENLPTQNFYTNYDYSDKITYSPVVSRRWYSYLVCNQSKLRALFMSANEGKYNFLNRKIRIIGLNDGYGDIFGYDLRSVILEDSAIVYNKNVARQGNYDVFIHKNYSRDLAYDEDNGFMVSINYYNKQPGFIENWTYSKKEQHIDGGYYYVPILDINEDGTFSNYNIDEVPYYNDNGDLVGYKLTGYLIDVKALKLSEEIIFKPIDE